MALEQKLLFTPGPLNTSTTVKQAMLVDLGSRDSEFMDAIREIKQGILKIVNADDGRFHAIPLQGSGTYGMESVISSCLHADSKLLVVANGVYGRRFGEIASRWKVPHEILEFEESEPPNPSVIDEHLSQGGFSHVSAVHCETTSGVLNPIKPIGQIAKKHDCLFIVDAMSSFGGIAIDMAEDCIDFLVSSSNKCLEGAPGFCFVVAGDEPLKKSEGQKRSLSLDLHEQWKVLESTGQFRFTPPTHVFLAFHQALQEFENEGGVAGRGKRYQNNHEALSAGMLRLGFEHYVPEQHQSCIISSFLYPNDPAFEFEALYAGLAEVGLVIYPGKVTKAQTFRIGTLGNLFPDDMKRLLEEMERVLRTMGCSIPVKKPH